MLGGEVNVPTLSGQVAMTIPEGTQNNRLLRLAGKGMPKVKGGGAGDQYVRLIGQLPQRLSEKERNLFKELAALTKRQERIFMIKEIAFTSYPAKDVEGLREWYERRSA